MMGDQPIVKQLLQLSFQQGCSIHGIWRRVAVHMSKRIIWGPWKQMANSAGEGVWNLITDLLSLSSASCSELPKCTKASQRMHSLSCQLGAFVWHLLPQCVAVWNLKIYWNGGLLYLLRCVPEKYFAQCTLKINKSCPAKFILHICTLFVVCIIWTASQHQVELPLHLVYVCGLPVFVQGK